MKGKLMKNIILSIILLLILSINLFCNDTNVSKSEPIENAVSKAFVQDELTKKNDIFNYLKSIGIEPSLTYKGEIWYVNNNPIKKYNYLDNFDLTLDMDLEKALNMKGSAIKLHILGNNGTDPAKETGVRQGLSNIAAPNAWKIFQLYFEQKLLNDNLSILIGLFDLNAHYDAKEVHSLFLNPSHGIGADFAQSGKNGPSIFPTSSFGLKFDLNFLPDNYLKLSVLDGVPGNPNKPYKTSIRFDKEDGFLVCAELGYNPKMNEQMPELELKKAENKYSKMAIGSWYYTPRLTQFDNFSNWGYYLFLEQKIFTESDIEQGIFVTGRFGIADDEINQFDSFINGSITYRGIIPTRDNDIFGFAFAWGHNSHLYRQISGQEGFSVERFEKAFELTYQFHTDLFLIQPGCQIILNPSNKEAKPVSNIVGFYTRLIMNI